MSDPRESGDDPLLPGDDDLPLEDDLDLSEESEEDEAAQPSEPDDDQLEEPPPRQQRNRASETIRSLRERAHRAEAERDILRQQPQARAPQPDPQQQYQQRQQEYTRISMLPPEEQAAAYHQMMQREVALARLEAFDLNDRSQFEQLKSAKPAAVRLAPQIEQILQQQRAAGIYSFSRRQIYHYLLGEEIDNRSGQNAGRQRAQGQRNVARQTTRPTRARGDVATGSNRTRGDDADRRLLEGTLIRDL